MIHSILDNDLYKFSMQHAVLTLFPRSKVRYKFINRSSTPFPPDFYVKLRAEIDKMAKLKLTNAEKHFFAERSYYLPPSYFDFLYGYRYDPSEVTVSQNGGELQVEIEGYWYRTILWEVPILALISELYFKLEAPKIYQNKKIVDIVLNKAQRYNNLNVKAAEFGTRRRFSYHVHDLVVRTLAEFGKPAFIGTSNVHFAMKYNVTPIGTHAHEWFMFHSAKYGFKTANNLSLENWVNVFRGNLGIALSDTFTTDVFFKAFDTKFAKLFDGVRHDSDDPILFIDKTVAHYQKHRIDPLSKTIIFSDTLTPEKVEKISNYCEGKIKASFGIGTNFTNDVGVKPLNIVIKMTDAKPDGQEWTSVIKLSDSRGKHTGDEKMIQMCFDELDINC